MARKAHDEAGPSASRGSGGATTARDNAEGSSSSRRPANGGQSNGAQDAFVYNPRQDPSDRRQVRSDYRQLIAEAEESRKDSSLKPRDLLQLIEKADSLHERVVAPSESILDTKTLSSMSEIGARMARKMKLNADAFDTNEFVTRLARYLGGEAAPVRSAGSGGAAAGSSSDRRQGQRYANGHGHVDDDDDEDDDDARQRVEDWDWAKLGRLAAGYSRRAVSIDFLLGPLEIVAKQRKQPTQRRVDDVPAERAAPQQLKQQDLQNNAENDTTAQVRKVARLLAEQGDGGVNLFRFVADPDSFTNTIENLFHVSFLVREGRASLAIDDDGNAILSQAQPPEDEDYSAGVQKRQFVMELDFPTYLEVIELYEIEESIIPTRRNTLAPLSGRAALQAIADGTSQPSSSQPNSQSPRKRRRSSSHTANPSPSRRAR